MDDVPGKVIKLWLLSAVAALACIVGAVYGFWEGMGVFTVFFSWMAHIAISVIMFAYITHHNVGNEIKAVAAWVTIVALSKVLTFLCV